jgi:hypothetical protein
MEGSGTERGKVEGRLQDGVGEGEGRLQDGVVRAKVTDGVARKSYMMEWRWRGQQNKMAGEKVTRWIREGDGYITEWRGKTE